MRFETYREAHRAAVLLARQLKREVGILRQLEFGKVGFNVYHLPKPQNRQGFELRCEVVSPTDPLSHLETE